MVDVDGVDARGLQRIARQVLRLGAVRLGDARISWALLVAWIAWVCSLALVLGSHFSAISEFTKGRKYLISLSFRGKASVRPAQVGGFDVNIVIHGSTAVRGRGDLVAYR